MMKFPSKLYGISESVIGKMTFLYGLIPDRGIRVEELYWAISKTMDVSDFIDALDCMYSIHTIDVIYSNIIINNAKRDYL